MDNITIQIMIQDETFAFAMKTALSRNDNRFIVTAGVKEKLSNQDIYLWNGKERTRKNGVFLVDRLEQVDEKNHRYYKYDNVKKLTEHLLLAYTEFTGNKLVSAQADGVKVFGFSAARGGVGCTTLSLAIAQELKRFAGKKVFYVSLEEFESTANYFKLGDMGISEFIYYKQLKNDAICTAFEKFIKMDEYGVEAFSPGKGRNPVLNMSKTEIMELFEWIFKLGRYDTIIVDIGNGTNELKIDILSLCEKICFIETDDGGRYKEYLNMKNETLNEKIISVINKYEILKEELDEETPILIAEESKMIQIPRDCDSLKDYKISLDTDFGLAIKELAISLN